MYLVSPSVSVNFFHILWDQFKTVFTFFSTFNLALATLSFIRLHCFACACKKSECQCRLSVA